MSQSLLLLSSSRVDDTPYLAHALPMLEKMIQPGSRWLFIPYAGVTISYDDYTNQVAEALGSLGGQVIGAHQTPDPVAALDEVDGVLVGGGNTFHLLHELYRLKLMDAIRDKVNNGMPYVGWSAGSNVAGLTIRTTNDMPIIQPPSFDALGLVPFQINPHFSDYLAPGHNGESRSMRLQEFTCVDPLAPVVGICEGAAIRRQGNALVLTGDKPSYLFEGTTQKEEIAPGSDISFLL